MKVEELKVNKANPRQIRDEKFKKLKKSVKEFPKMMELRPIVIDDDGTILGGNMRFRALLELGYKEIPDSWVRKASELTDEEKQRFIIEDNVEFGEWDYDKLANEWDDELLNEWGLELPTISNEVEANEDDYEIPDEIKTDIVIGDLIEFYSGEKLLHRLLCGDSTDAEQVSKLMKDEKADMVFTDPPYNVEIKSVGRKYGKIHGEFQQASGEMREYEFINFLKKSFENYVNNSKDGSIHFICMDWRHIYEIIIAGREKYTELKNLVVWNKDNAGMGTFYRPKHELIFVFKNGTNKHINNFGLGGNGRYRTNVWDYPSVNSFNGEKESLKLHPTVKPLKMVADAIIDCSNEGNLICDYFLGSGTTMAASHQTKRRCFGMELDPKYCQVIIDRMLKLDNGLQILKNGNPL